MENKPNSLTQKVFIDILNKVNEVYRIKTYQLMKELGGNTRSF